MTTVRVETRHTSQLDATALGAARQLVDEAFDGDFDELDWEHALGGMHAIVWEGSELIGHGAVVQRRLLHQGRALRCGYVEAVGVRRDHQRRGHGARVMAELERVIRAAYDLGALSATDEAVDFYLARGWQRWEGETYALTPSGEVRTADDDGGVFVLPVAVALDLDGPLTCDWRDGDVW
jgi:aminoglycoside 2'-N-acetyltransferase I